MNFRWKWYWSPPRRRFFSTGYLRRFGKCFTGTLGNLKEWQWSTHSITSESRRSQGEEPVMVKRTTTPKGAKAYPNKWTLVFPTKVQRFDSLVQAEEALKKAEERGELPMKRPNQHWSRLRRVAVNPDRRVGYFAGRAGKAPVVPQGIKDAGAMAM
jgi:hypothetical protein